MHRTGNFSKKPVPLKCCVCVCVYVREREREKTEKKRENSDFNQGLFTSQETLAIYGGILGCHTWEVEAY